MPVLPILVPFFSFIKVSSLWSVQLLLFVAFVFVPSLAPRVLLYLYPLVFQYFVCSCFFLRLNGLPHVCFPLVSSIPRVVVLFEVLVLLIQL